MKRENNLMLILIVGLPGTGKSLLSEKVGRRLGIPVFAKDWIEGVLALSGVNSNASSTKPLSYVAYEILNMLIERQLKLKQSCIIECVGNSESLRSKWCDIAEKYAVALKTIECTCSDIAVHQARVVRRRRRIPGINKMEWHEVQKMQLEYHAWELDRLIIDGANNLSTNVQAVLSYLSYCDKVD